MKVQSLKGVYIKNDDDTTRIIIEREYKKKDTVNFFYFGCNKTGGGTILKSELLNSYTKEK